MGPSRSLPQALGTLSSSLHKLGNVHIQADDLATAVCETEETVDGDS